MSAAFVLLALVMTFIPPCNSRPIESCLKSEALLLSPGHELFRVPLPVNGDPIHVFVSSTDLRQSSAKRVAIKVGFLGQSFCDPPDAKPLSISTVSPQSQILINRFFHSNCLDSSQWEVDVNDRPAVVGGRVWGDFFAPWTWIVDKHFGRLVERKKPLSLLRVSSESFHVIEISSNCTGVSFDESHYRTTKAPINIALQDYSTLVEFVLSPQVPVIVAIAVLSVAASLFIARHLSYLIILAAGPPIKLHSTD